MYLRSPIVFSLVCLIDLPKWDASPKSRAYRVQSKTVAGAFADALAYPQMPPLAD